MDTVEFANGAVHDCPFLATTRDKAFIALSGVSFAEAAAIFSNQELTKEITYGDWKLHGYTELQYLMQEPYGIKACLTGGYDERGGI